MRTALYLFTDDLRVSDNAALHLCRGFERCEYVFVVHKTWFEKSQFVSRMGYGRWQFLLESLSNLQQQLNQLGAHLHIIYAENQTALDSLVQQSGASHLIVSRQFGWYEQQFIQQLQTRHSLTLNTTDNSTLFSAEGKPWLHTQLPGQYTPFRKLAEAETSQTPFADITELPPNKLDPTPTLTLPDWLPSPSSVKTAFNGGEAAAKRHIEAYFSTTAPSTYKQTRNALEGWDNSSKFSPWLAVGCISPRQLLQRIEQYEQEHGANDSTYWLYFELLWREYFQWSALSRGVKLFSFKGTAKTAPKTSFYPEHFKRWSEGNTPYPLVNACMQELQQTGFLSNRGRQIVASCLVNEMNCDWRYGAAWFEHHLLDYDVASNWGNWQYIAGVGADPRGGRHFNIEKQTQQYDPDGEYTKKWAKAQELFPVYTQDPAGWPIPLSSKFI